MVARAVHRRDVVPRPGRDVTARDERPTWPDRVGRPFRARKRALQDAPTKTLARATESPLRGRGPAFVGASWTLAERAGMVARARRTGRDDVVRDLRPRPTVARDERPTWPVRVGRPFRARKRALQDAPTKTLARAAESPLRGRGPAFVGASWTLAQRAGMVARARPPAGDRRARDRSATTCRA